MSHRHPNRTASMYVASDRLVRYIGFTFLVILLTTASADGFVLFMPGDSFFHVKITSATIKTVAEWKEGPLTLSYYPPAPRLSRMTDHVGFVTCEINGCDQIELSGLTRGYEVALRRRQDEPGSKDAEATTEEWVHCFVYGRAFQYQKYRVGLKYNEKWNTPLNNQNVLWGGEGRSVAVYAPFTNDSDLIVEDWFNSEHVPSLPGTIPEGVNWKHIGPYLRESFRIDAKEVFFILVCTSQLPSVMRQERGAWFVEVSANEKWIVERRENGWKRVAMD